jgi:hypothetical protein
VVAGYSSKYLAEKILEVIHDQEFLDRIAIHAKKDIEMEEYNVSTREITDLYTLVASL